MGRPLATIARQRGHELTVLARSTGVELTDRAQLADKLRGSDAVIDVTSIATRSAKASREFFAQVHPGFAALWESQPVPGTYCDAKRILHSEVGEVELYGQTILDPDQFQALMIFTAEPGSFSAEELELLLVIGAHP